MPHSRAPCLILALGLLSFFATSSAKANQGWNTGLQGDARSVGRGGTGIVLSDDLWGVFENPAGSALTVPGTQFQYTRNTIHDQKLLGPDQNLSMYSAGGVAPQTPWGFAAGLTESNQAALVTEYAISASRLFFDEHLSLGTALNYGKSPATQAWGTTLGAQFRRSERLIFGMSFRTPLEYRAADGTVFSHPWSVGLGVGKIPNRYFKSEFGISLKGPTLPGTNTLSLQPHAGIEYELISFRQLQLRLYSGTYLENSRMHATFGFGTDPWIFSLGASIDVASQYRNTLFAVGVDVGRTLKKFKVAPSTLPAPPGGLFPKPFEASDDWFPPRLQDDPENSFQEIGPSPERIIKRIGNIDQIIKDQPKALEEEGAGFSKDWKDLKEELR
ncbi:hypothetical protein WDW86_12040 [Bdellovibrionota bacterium FG-2]